MVVVFTADNIDPSTIGPAVDKLDQELVIGSVGSQTGFDKATFTLTLARPATEADREQVRAALTKALPNMKITVDGS